MNFVEWKRACPYGLWTCRDGREVLFNRQYWPILERCPPNLCARPADPGEWVPWIEQDYFFTDGNPPWDHDPTRARATLKRINTVLAAWGAPTLAPVPRRPRAWSAEPMLVPFALRDDPTGIPRRINPWGAILAGH